MKPQILVAEDSATIRKLILISLNEFDVEFTFARDVYELYEAASKMTFHLIIVDGCLTGVDSASDLAEIVKRTSSPLLILKGSYDALDDKSLAKHGLQHVLSKPFERMKLISTINAMSGNILAGPEPFVLPSKASPQKLALEVVEPKPQQPPRFSIAEDLQKRADLAPEIARQVEDYCQKHLRVMLKELLQEELKALSGKS